MIEKAIKLLAYLFVILSLFSALWMSRLSWTFYSSDQQAQVISLPDVIEPVDLAVANGKIIIAETTHIAIYSLRDFHLEKKFSRRGEGPGEFNHPPHITAYPDRLLVNTMGKLIHYSYDGTLIEETKIIFPYNYGAWPMLPIGENYVGFPIEIEKIAQGSVRFSHVGRLYDHEFKPFKQLCEAIHPLVPPPPPPPKKGSQPKPPPKQDFDVIPEYVDYAIVEDKIFLADNRRGFHISVFDDQGNLLYEIDKAYEQMKVSKEYKENYMKRQRAQPDWENLQRRFNYKFKENFPAFFSFKVSDNKIYMTTYKNEDGNYEVVVMDLVGNILKRLYSFPFVPYHDPSYSYTLFSNEYEICQDKIFSLAYNDETDTYELHITPIKKESQPFPLKI